MSHRATSAQYLSSLMHNPEILNVGVKTVRSVSFGASRALVKKIIKCIPEGMESAKLPVISHQGGPRREINSTHPQIFRNRDFAILGDLDLHHL